ncbi:MAG: molecular chaperone DnaK, partial [Acidobacteria bacterium]
RRKEEIEARNKADQAVYGAEKMLQDMGSKLTSSDKAAVETAIEQLKSAITQNDTAAMNRAMEALTTAQHRAAEALYKNAGASTGAGAEGAGGAAGSAGSAGPAGAGAQGSGAAQGDVIDAEVVDEEKK